MAFQLMMGMGRVFDHSSNYTKKLLIGYEIGRLEETVKKLKKEQEKTLEQIKQKVRAIYGN